MSPKSFSASLSSDRYTQVLSYVRSRVPFPIRSHLVLGNDVPLFPNVTFFDYVVIAQRRYWASSRNNNIANSLVAVQTGSDGEVSIGELSEIFVVTQHALQTPFFLGYVRWLVQQPLTKEELSKSAWLGR